MLCNEETGDEVHFLTVCPNLNDLQEDLTRAMVNCNNEYQFLDPVKKTRSILQAYAWDQSMSNAVYHMNLHRTNLLR